MDKINNELEINRAEIDRIDKEILTLFASRMEKVMAIAKYKLANNLDITDQQREEKVLAQTEVITDPEIKAHAMTLLKTIMDLSKKFQTERFRKSNPDQEDFNVLKYQDEIGITVGFQGLPGSFSEQALIEYYGEGVREQSYASFEGVFKALQTEEIDYGVLPLENSFTGGISEVYDLLSSYGFYIVGEKIIKVDHNLLAGKGVGMESVTEIISHPQAFLQCSDFLQGHPEWNLVPGSNTAVSAKMVGESAAGHQAAIASKRAAEIYDMSVLAEGIHNSTDNSTRFIIIGRKPKCVPENNKVSLLVAIAHEPGSLYKILSYFAEYGLNMLKIESRPRQGRNWESLFYIDFEGNLEKQEVKNTVEGIAKESISFKMLGNYRSDLS